MTARVRLLAALGLAALLLAALASLQAPPLQAQMSTVTLVSNIGGGNDAIGSDGIIAQSFMTGSNNTGYSFSELDFHLRQTEGDDTTVRIRGNNSSDRPGDLVAVLTNPSSLQDSLNTFTAANEVILEPDTTYWIVISEGQASNNRPRVLYKSQNGETSSYDWTIGDGLLFKTLPTDGWTALANSVRMTIRGNERTASTDATLSDLTVRESTGATVSLTQSTVGGVRQYEGSVGDASSYITIEPETTDANAEVEYLDASDNPLSDTQSSVDGFQVNLVDGRNEIRVRVVAEDQTTTQVYKLVVKRAGVPGQIELAVPLIYEVFLGVGDTRNISSWLRLSKQPSADVEVTSSSSVDHIAVFGSPTITFTPANWSSWQSFTLVGSPPPNTNAAHTFTYTAASADPRFDGVQARQVVNLDAGSPPDYHLHRIAPRTGLALGERDLPDESLSVYVDNPYYETMNVATEGFFWTPSGIWGDRDADTVWVVNPAHFGIHPLKLSALRQGRIERHVAEVPSNTTATGERLPVQPRVSLRHR